MHPEPAIENSLSLKCTIIHSHDFENVEQLTKENDVIFSIIKNVIGYYRQELIRYQAAACCYNIIYIIL